MIATTLGGIGLFLLGMVLLTDGLKAAAGEALRRVLARFTGGPLRAFASGAGATLLVQSSSATILTTIGFVSAGLLAFPQAIGVIIGAAVGTTSTGWLVSLVGLKFSMSVVALPLVGVGALMRLLGRARVASVGTALAGFGLLFVGIDTLQSGMQGLSERLDPALVSGETLAARGLLVVLGLVMTVVMQSSSAAVATTLTALHAGAIRLPEAALLVIGQNIGTVVTAMLASIGASTSARRTALAHIGFNTFAGALALLLLAPFLALVAAAHGWRGGIDETAALAAFHTAFNILAAAAALPLAHRYAALIGRVVPERELAITRHLDASVATVPAVAVEAARRAVTGVAVAVLSSVQDLITDESGHQRAAATLGDAEEALRETRRFLAGVRTSPESPTEYHRHVDVLHAVDHLDRMIDHLKEASSLRTVATDPELRDLAADRVRRLGPVIRWLRGGGGEEPAAEAESLSRSLAEVRRARRESVLRRTASGEIEPDRALRLLEAMRWADALLYHTWRAVHHLALRGGPGIPSETEPGTERAAAGAAEA